LNTGALPKKISGVRGLAPEHTEFLTKNLNFSFQVLTKTKTIALLANSEPDDHFFNQALSEFVWERGAFFRERIRYGVALTGRSVALVVRTTTDSLSLTATP
jgi:hypothetical protein